MQRTKLFRLERRQIGDSFLQRGQDFDTLDRVDPQVVIEAHPEIQHLGRITSLLRNHRQHGRGQRGTRSPNDRAEWHNNRHGWRHRRRSGQRGKRRWRGSQTVRRSLPKGADGRRRLTTGCDRWKVDRRNSERLMADWLSADDSGLFACSHIPVRRLLDHHRDGRRNNRRQEVHRSRSRLRRRGQRPRSLRQFQMPLREGLERAQCGFLSFQEPLMQSRGFLLHPLEYSQVFPDRRQRLIRRWSIGIEARCGRFAGRLGGDPRFCHDSGRTALFAQRRLARVEWIDIENAALGRHDVTWRRRLERGRHRRARRDRGARLHVVGSTNRNAQPVRTAGVFWRATSVRIPLAPLNRVPRC